MFHVLMESYVRIDHYNVRVERKTVLTVYKIRMKLGRFNTTCLYIFILFSTYFYCLWLT